MMMVGANYDDDGDDDDEETHNEVRMSGWSLPQDSLDTKISLRPFVTQPALAQKPSVVSIPEFKRLNVIKSNYFVPEMI